MKRIVQSLAMFALLIGNCAYAATYTYTGDNFTIVNGVYTDDMRVTGTLVTSSPIPPNYEGEIGDIVVSWSFNDGVQTIDSSNGEFNPGFPPAVMTDENGVIVDSFLVFFSSPLATTIGETDDYIGVVFSQAIGVTGAVCLTVADGVCESYEPPVNFGQSESPGTWVVSGLSEPVPTMTQWSLMLLVLMLGVVGIARVRRKVRL